MNWFLKTAIFYFYFVSERSIVLYLYFKSWLLLLNPKYENLGASLRKFNDVIENRMHKTSKNAIIFFRCLKISDDDDAADELMSLSPYEMRNLLHHVMSGREFSIHPCQTQQSGYNIITQNDRVSKVSLVVYFQNW